MTRTGNGLPGPDQETGVSSVSVKRPISAENRLYRRIGG